MNLKSRKTVVIGASTNPVRYSNTAVKDLVKHGYPVIAIGLQNNKIGDTEVQTGFPEIEDVHTVTMYVGPKNQSQYTDYILNQLKPKRIIFNPGTENNDFEQLAVNRGIEVVNNCTLVMLDYEIF